MDFYEEIKSRGLLDVLHYEKYKPPVYKGWEKVKLFLLDAVKNNKSVYIEGDYDVDGLFAALTIKEGLQALDMSRLGVYQFRQRTHAVDSIAVQQAIQGHYDYFIVVDTGSSDLSLLRKLVKYGTKVIILDHHVTDLDYEDFGDDIAMINTTIENRFGGDFQLSAGALCFTVMDLLFRELDKESPRHLAAFAVVTLFADVMNMHNKFNRAIYYYATEQSEESLPKQVLYFKNQYSLFNARYIGYWLAPRINACFRSEVFELLNMLFLNDDDSCASECIRRIEYIYVDSRNLVHKVSDIIGNFCTEMQNLVYTDLNRLNAYMDVYGQKLYNYTGLIANNLSERFGKTGVVTCRMDNFYKGSVRDPCGRNYLNVFKQLCYAGGHEAAFGLRINVLDYDEFIQDLRHVDENFALTSVDNLPIIVELEDTELPDISLIQDIASYNEFAGPGVPVVLLRKRIIGNIYEKKTTYNYKYIWGDLEIQSDNKIQFGRVVNVRPVNSWKLKLLVQT